jgi:uncharacterized protein
MKWQGHRQRDRIEDLRDGGGSRPRVGGRGLSLGGIVIAVIAAWIFGINPMTVLGLVGGGGQPQPQAPQGAPLQARSEADQFIATVLADTEDVWQGLLADRRGYEPPRLRLFRDQVQSACGSGDAAMGPFYCPGDEHIYIDLGFFDQLRGQLGAPGDFAQAYVVAHEVGHHIQHRLGISAKVQQARQRMPEAQANQLSVRLELQADCLAGVWAHHSQRGKNWLEQGDLQEAMNAAARIGDDVLQKASRGTVVPESFTHGSAAQRQRWFQAGYQIGRLDSCDTFGAKTL